MKSNSTPPEPFNYEVEDAKRNPIALNNLLKRLRPILKQHAEKNLDGRLSARVDGSDVVQESLDRIARKIASFQKGDGLSFTKWVYQIQRNILTDLHRRHVQTQTRTINLEHTPPESFDSLSVNVLQQLLTSKEGSPSADMLTGDRARHLVESIEKLPRDQKTVVNMRFIDQKPVNEIAILMNRSANAVSSLLQRAIKKLAKALEKNEI